MVPGYYYHECFENFSAHRKRAGKLQALMKKYQFNYDQAEAFLSFSAIRNLLYLSAFRGPRACKMLCIVICQATGLVEEDAISMMEQYMLFHAKAQVTSILDKLYNKHYSIWNRYTNSIQKLDRVQSLSAAAAQVTTFDALIDLPRIQFGLFSNTLVLEANPLLPKHMQPLSNNDTTCELAQVVTDMLKCARLNKANLPRKLK